MLRGHSQRGIYRLMRMLGVPSAVNSAAVTAYMSATETIGEEQDVGVTSRRDRKGAEVIDADGKSGPFG